MFESTKRFGPITTSHRNWHASYCESRDAQKCAWQHGYSRYLKLTFSGKLDETQWVYDFGDCKFIKEFLDINWDHKTLISSDDPELPIFKELHAKNLISLNIIDTSRKDWGPGIEGSCRYIFDNIQPTIDKKTNGRVRIIRVEIWEHEFNSATFIPEESDFETHASAG